MIARLAAAILLAGCGGDAYAPTEDPVGEPCAADAECGDLACEGVGGTASVCTGPCSEDADCGSAGRCVDVGVEGDPRRRCLLDCAGDAPCPAETECVVFAGEPASVCR